MCCCALGSQPYESRKVHLHAPLEDGQGAASGEGAVSVLVTKNVAGVQLLVDIGVRLELVAWVAACLKQHTHPRKVLVLNLQNVAKISAHMHVPRHGKPGFEREGLPRWSTAAYQSKLWCVVD